MIRQDDCGVGVAQSRLREQFAIEVADEEMVPENLDTVRNIVAFVERKRG